MESSFLILCIAALVLVPGLSSGSSCNSKYVRCGEDGDCIHYQYVCDGTQHCKDGRDEDQDLCSYWKPDNGYSSSCGRGNMYCNHNCYNMWDGCHRNCPSDIRSGDMCKIVTSKELPEPYRGMDLEPKSRQKRQWLWGTSSDDEDDIEGYAEGSGNDGNDEDAETVNMLSKAVTSKISEFECPMLYTKVGNYCVSFFSLAQVPWAEARQFCQSIHGDLLAIENINMYTEILDNIRKKGLSSDFWLGGRYDMDLNNWCWLDDTPMPSNSPYWALRYNSKCESRSPSGKCFNYIQLPEQHEQGYCAAMNYESYFYISDDKCSLRKSPLCLIDYSKLHQVA